MNPDEIRNQIKELAVKYYDCSFKNRKKDRIYASGKIFDEKELLNGIDAVLDGVWTHGRFSEIFQKSLSNFLGIRHAIITNSGSSANLLAVSSLFVHDLGKNKMNQGDEIITTASGFPTTINPIIQNGAIPVFVDIKKDTFNIDESLVEDAISDKTRAIVVAHTLGNPINISKITEICKEHGLFLVEDSCDALGSKYDGRYVSTFGDIGTFSFYPAHQITTAEGGAIVTGNPTLKKAVESIRDWGRDCWCMPGVDNTCGKRFSWKLGDLPEGYDHKYTYSRIGYNLKGNDILAAIGIAQLEKLPLFIEKRKKNYDMLRKCLTEFNDYFYFQEKERLTEPCWFGFLITLREDAGFTRNEIIKFLEDNGISTRLLFGGNITKQPYFKNYDIKYRISGKLINTDNAMKNSFWIGVYPGITEYDIHYIYEKFKEFINGKKGK